MNFVGTNKIYHQCMGLIQSWQTPTNLDLYPFMDKHKLAKLKLAYKIKVGVQMIAKL